MKKIKLYRRIFMKKNRVKKLLSLLLLVVLIAAMALTGAACDNTNHTPEAPKITAASGNVTVLGEGSKVFDFTVFDFEGNVTDFEIYTDKKTVGDALSDLGLIEGEEGAYGLYVKVVNGIKADYDTDSKYWAFYIDDELAPTGADTTAIEEGKVYSFRVE